jgi:hypothetical protein
MIYGGQLQTEKLEAFAIHRYGRQGQFKNVPALLAGEQSAFKANVIKASAASRALSQALKHPFPRSCNRPRLQLQWRVIFIINHLNRHLQSR